MSYKPPVIGQISGPHLSSPGNPLPYQTMVYGQNGWVPFLGKTYQEVLNKAQQLSEEIKNLSQPDKGT